MEIANSNLLTVDVSRRAHLTGSTSYMKRIFNISIYRQLQWKTGLYTERLSYNLGLKLWNVIYLLLGCIHVTAHICIFKLFCYCALAEVYDVQQLATFCHLILQRIKELDIFLPQFLIKYYLMHDLGVNLSVPRIHMDRSHTDAEKNTCGWYLEKQLFHLLRVRKTCVLILPEGFETHI